MIAYNNISLVQAGNYPTFIYWENNNPTGFNYPSWGISLLEQFGRKLLSRWRGLCVPWAFASLNLSIPPRENSTVLRLEDGMWADFGSPLLRASHLPSA